ncbi:apolipoprotein D-like [Branchiostoma lanceolatum]|uniref:apolipoprotein D-like n=1 Tax=Branchiostoma lanceolatum TaxID=7740 RepID=UPI0034557A72
MAFLPLLPLALALVSVTYVEGQVPGFGKCPTVNVQQDFDIHPYMGEWYEIEKFPAAFESGKCVRANYTLQANGHVKVDNEGTLDDGKLDIRIGDLYNPDPKYPSKLAVRFASAAPYGAYWVLKTDYKTYTLIWSCSSVLGLGNVQFMWILAREHKVDPAIMADLHKVAAGYGIDVSKMTTTDQSGCTN